VPEEATRASFDTVYMQSRSWVVRTAFLMVGSHAIAEEIAQEAFLRLHQHFDQVENPGGFLRTAVVRLCLSWRRRAVLEGVNAASSAEPGPTGIAEIDTTWDVMATLKPEHRAALVLRYYEDLSHEEIAAVMRCRVTTARSRVHRALAALRKELER
jgi:RNA polymerase sigma factor (sigma-70 family)